jgi:glycine/D-amino acid oxidase-like deaminating enzyme
MPSNSLWLTQREQVYAPLEGDVSADAVVVGGGITGLTTAYHLTRTGMNVVLLEARELARGTSGHTTAHVTSQHGLVYARLVKQFGRETAAVYARANEDAIGSMEETVGREAIDCGWVRQDSMAFTHSHARLQDIMDETAAAKELGIDADLRKGGDFVIPYLMAVRFRRQAMFHPVKYLHGLAAAITRGGGRIFESSRVQHVVQGRVETHSGSVSAPRVVLATHLPVVNFPGWYFARMVQSRSYVLALSRAEAIEGIWDCIDKNGKSWRMYRDLLIIADSGHRCGTQGRTGHFEKLRSFAARRIPGSLPECQWSAQDGITVDGLPYIGRYSRKTPWLFTASGFAKWGMTQGTAAGIILSALVKGDPDPSLGAFSPQRRVGLPGFAGLVWQNAATLGHLTTGFLRFGPPLCAHMKCRLVWNRDERTWDCPCHGSRFDESGNVLDTPAIHGIRQ